MTAIPNGRITMPRGASARDLPATGALQHRMNGQLLQAADSQAAMERAEMLMRLAIEKAKQGIAAGQSPFGCAIARQDELLSAAHNTVRMTTDITAHAEVNALRAACKKAGDIFLMGCLAVTTCEPCPMCMAALHWARIDTVVYGATIGDAKAAGFNEIEIPAAQIVRLGRLQVRLIPGILAEECRELFHQWRAAPGSRHY